MGRRVKDFVEISDYTSLDALINVLTAIRDSLPDEAEPELKLRGDDIFGRRLTITSRRAHHSAKLPSGSRHIGLRQRWRSLCDSRTASSSMTMPRPGPCGIGRKPSCGVSSALSPQ